ncbi:MAG: DUF4406 domain-containing protein [Sporomusa sphaeroides]|uniref:DUF7768 domain-containing protein n=1 Tax=Sporomusa TaxID=2375 RepID=UPI0028049135|nr:MULTISPECIES: DUF4406 domain-containing protein [Sporomusa]
MYVCSPLRGDIETNVRRAHGYCRFVIHQGALPLAPHAIFTAFLDDTIPQERQLGMALGMELLKRSDELWVFGKRISEGMLAEIEAATACSLQVHYFDERCEKRYPHAEP